MMHLYLATEQSLVQMVRSQSFERVPVAGEFVHIAAGGLLPHRVDEVSHLSDGTAEVYMRVPRHPDGGWDLYGSEEELDEELEALTAGGWSMASRTKNNRFRNLIGSVDRN